MELKVQLLLKDTALLGSLKTGSHQFFGTTNWVAPSLGLIAIFLKQNDIYRFQLMKSGGFNKALSGPACRWGSTLFRCSEC